jgi:hypothetical protein
MESPIPVKRQGESDTGGRWMRVTLLGSSAEPARARPPSLLGMGISTRDRKVQRVRS